MTARPAAAQEEAQALHRREAALALVGAERNAQVLELRRALAAALAAGEPSITQLKQLMLEPAINRYVDAQG